MAGKCYSGIAHDCKHFFVEKSDEIFNLDCKIIVRKVSSNRFRLAEAASLVAG
jgi:hypothetical protein